jgi:hypothetical protein
VDGWRYTSATGRASHNFALRAAYAKYIIGANVPEELVYPNTAVDGDGDPLTGERRYQLRFAAGQVPSASVLWNMHVRPGPAVHRERLRPLPSVTSWWTCVLH